MNISNYQNIKSTTFPREFSFYILTFIVLSKIKKKSRVLSWLVDWLLWLYCLSCHLLYLIMISFSQVSFDGKPNCIIIIFNTASTTDYSWIICLYFYIQPNYMSTWNWYIQPKILIVEQKWFHYFKISHFCPIFADKASTFFTIRMIIRDDFVQKCKNKK